MAYIEIINQNTLVLDNNQKKLVGGKISFLDPVSLNPINVYTYNATSDSYVIAENPIYLDVNSRPEHTYFVNQMAYCRLYKYIGEFSDPMIGDDDSNWEYVRDWYGEDSSDGDNTEADVNPTVIGITALQNANNNGQVTVIGYWNEHDCEARTYVWDPVSTQEADNGYIVRSFKSDNGRWILKYDGEWLPSTYYGVYPGHEENMNALLGYAGTVGSWAWDTAPGIYFMKGTYDATTQVKTTNKKVLVDADTEFVWNQFNVAGLNVIGTPVHAIGDFHFSNKNQEVHSSYFRTVDAMYSSNCGKLIIDDTNYWKNSTLSIPKSLEKIIIEGSKRMAISYKANAYLTINNCTIIGENIWTLKDDYIKFVNMTLTDKWFGTMNANMLKDAFAKNAAELTNHTKHVLCKTSDINKILFNEIENTAFYAEAIASNGETTLDLVDGREISYTFYTTLSKFSVFKNMKITSKSTESFITKSNTQFYNVVLDKVVLIVANGSSMLLDNTKGTLYIVDKSNYTLSIRNGSDIHTQGKVNAHNSTVYGENSTIEMDIEFPAISGSTVKDTCVATYAQAKNCTFSNCTINNSFFATNYLGLLGCTLNSTYICLYPVYVDDNTKSFISTIDGNKFYGTSKLYMTIKDFSTQHNTMKEMVCNNLIVTNNEFRGSDEWGIYMPAITTLTGYIPFVKYLNWKYYGNRTWGSKIPQWNNLNIVYSNNMTHKIVNATAEDFMVTAPTYFSYRIPANDPYASVNYGTTYNMYDAYAWSDGSTPGWWTNESVTKVVPWLFSAWKIDTSKLSGTNCIQQGHGDAFMNCVGWNYTDGEFKSKIIRYHYMGDI